MKMLFVFMLLVGCRAPTLEERAEFLFEKDGCKVYQYWNGLKTFVFSTCPKDCPRAPEVLK